VAYPLVVTGIAKAAFRDKAEGSLVVRNGRVVGSSLIGQPFGDPKYFWGRLSAVDYNAGASGGSNLGPTSEQLKKNADARIAALKER
jgi:K+-transporting ATPase ATPase C chain